VPEYPHRLATFDYVGAHAYFLTFCTFERNRLFVTPASVAIVHEQILRVCAAHGFQIDAYCYMPDHVHMVITATASDSDLKTFITREADGRLLFQESNATKALAAIRLRTSSKGR
jgi:REP element-mobilizing transposase RayT